MWKAKPTVKYVCSERYDVWKLEDVERGRVTNAQRIGRLVRADHQRRHVEDVRPRWFAVGVVDAEAVLRLDSRAATIQIRDVELCTNQQYKTASTLQCQRSFVGALYRSVQVQVCQPTLFAKYDNHNRLKTRTLTPA